MDYKKTKEDLLAHFITPAFFVEGGVITQVNQAAQQQLIATGTQISALLATGQEEYGEFLDGCLYLSLKIQDQPRSTTVTKEGGRDLFLVEYEEMDRALQAYSLAARELREPLAGIMIASERLLRSLPEDSDPLQQRQAAFINQNLYKMLRILGNMSDASRFVQGSDVCLQYCNVTSVLDEIFQDVAANCEKSSIRFSYTCPKEEILGPIDQAKLERGVLNLISNAIKYTRSDGEVTASVVKRGKRLYITITDSGDGVPIPIHETIYKRYQRMAGIEEARQGIGLGMVLAKSVAAMHGGTILMQPQQPGGARITMTVSLENKGLTLRSPTIRVDYTGERSHSLVELSDSLDPSLYSIKSLK